MNAPNHLALRLLNFIMRWQQSRDETAIRTACYALNALSPSGQYGSSVSKSLWRSVTVARACNLDIDELKRNATDALPLLIQSILPLISQPKEMRAVGLPTTNHREKSHSQILGEGRICH